MSFSSSGMNRLAKANEIQSRYVLPTIEEKTAYGYKRLDPYTKLFEERIIFVGQAIDDTCLLYTSDAADE